MIWESAGFIGGTLPGSLFQTSKDITFLLCKEQVQVWIIKVFFAGFLFVGEKFVRIIKVMQTGETARQHIVKSHIPIPLLLSENQWSANLPLAQN